MTQGHDYDQADPLSVASLPLQVEDVMTSPAVTVEPAATVKEIAEILIRHDIRAVPVVDIGDVLVGLVSEADVICRECPTARRHTLGAFVDRLLGHEHDWAEKAEGITAGEIMTTPVIFCAPSDLVAVAARRMLVEDVRMMPVVKDGQLVGVLSRHDILRVFDRPDTEIRRRIAQFLASPLRSPDGHKVRAEVLDGVVRLSGSVRYPGDIAIVVSVIGEVPGVIEVRDQLTAELPEPKLTDLAEADSW
jgi:CBS domain-containing protein